MDVEALGPIVLLTLLVSGLATLFASLVGLPLGVWLGLSRSRVASLGHVISQTGMALPPVVVGLGLYLLLSRGGPLGDWGWLYTPKAMIAAQTILAIPFVVGVTAAAVAAVPEDLGRQLRAIGASDAQARWAIVREARGGALLAVATALGRSLSEVGAVWLVGGNIQGETRVLTTAIVLETGKGRFAFALALGAILLAIALTVNVAIVRRSWRTLA